MTANYLFVGDTHGDLDFIERVALLAAEYDATILQVGDWGYVWPGSNQLAALDRILEHGGEFVAKPGVTMHFCDGNHDDHPTLRTNVEMHSMADATLPGGGVRLKPNVIYQPRGSTHTDADGTTFLFCGGAPSIDHWNRTPGKSWWAEEVISEEEYERALAYDGPVHVLVTHDAPDYPPGFEPRGDAAFLARSWRSMEMIAGLIRKHNPALHVHGHWHHRYSRMYGDTKVVGLGSNLGRFNDAIMLWSRA